MEDPPGNGSVASTHVYIPLPRDGSLELPGAGNRSRVFNWHKFALQKMVSYDRHIEISKAQQVKAFAMQPRHLCLILEPSKGRKTEQSPP